MVHNEANALRVLFLVSSIIVSSIVVSSIIVSSIIVSPAGGGLTNERCVMRCGFYCCFIRFADRGSTPFFISCFIIVSPAGGGLTNERCYAMRFLLLFHPPEAGFGLFPICCS
jgi:hypothetical protein